MKVAVVTRFVHAVGGIETYLAAVLPALSRRGVEVRVWHEHPATPGEAMLGSTTESHWLGHGDTLRTALASLSAWQPDLLFVHGLDDADIEGQLPRAVPRLTMLHAYDGTCVSGTKLRTFPSPAPCSRRLGPGCLLQYYPRRCGGWSPVTMMRLYRHQRRRQHLLVGSSGVATLSSHMRQEALTQGVAAHLVQVLPAFVPACVEAVRSRPTADGARHVGFIGRIERAKGVHLLLEAVMLTSLHTRDGLRLTIAGDGRDRSACEAASAALRTAGVTCTFTGWLDADARTSLFETLDLLVVPSVWPEPFGLVGLEAASAGVPALGFDVGGIGEWLKDGVTGRLLTGPASAAPLAAALDECLADRAQLATWGANAQARSAVATLERHIDALLDLLGSTARTPVASGVPA